MYLKRGGTLREKQFSRRRGGEAGRNIQNLWVGELGAGIRCEFAAGNRGKRETIFPPAGGRGGAQHSKFVRYK